MNPIHIIDSHTAGEPTRIVIAGGPDLGTGTVAQRVETFRTKHDRFRSAVVNEPRGSDVLVGALLCEPADPSCSLGVIFFNNVGYLGMCGHGTIGLIATLAHLGRIKPGIHRIETNVGIVSATLHNTGEVSVDNVPSHRTVKDFPVEIADAGGTRQVHGDIAWGGNWFFLVSDHGQSLELRHVDGLTDLSWRIRQAVNKTHPEIDHVELFAPAPARDAKTQAVSGDAKTQASPATLASWRPAHSRNFVLCPGKAYDRSPCGTGTSAKLACLAADGKLDEGQQWIQESILGTRFTGSFKWLDRAKGIIAPTITGSAYITADAKLLLDDRDPFQWGIRA